MKRMFASLGLCLGSAVLLLSVLPTFAQSAWKPLRPQGVEIRYELARVDLGTPRGQRYTLVSLGDTLRFDLRGATRLRVETRPLFLSPDTPGEFRYTLELGEANVRHFKRKSRYEGAARARAVTLDDRSPGGDTSMLLGRRDRLEIELPAGGEELVLTMRKAPIDRVLLRVLVDDLPEGQTIPAAKPHRRGRRGPVRVEADLARLGYDSNPYRAASEGGNSKGKAYWPARIAVEARTRPRDALELKAGYEFEGQFYDDPILQETAHTGDFSQSWRGWRRDGQARLRLSLDQQIRARQSTFFGRGEQEEFETTSGAATVPLGNRFDYRQLRLRARADYDISPSLELMSSVSFRDRNYKEDFAEFADIYALDYDALSFDVELAWASSEIWAGRLYASQERKDYDEKFARSSDGTETPETPSSLRRRALGVGVDVRDIEHMVITLYVEGFQSRDLRDGYWDYDGIRYGLRVRRRLPEGHSLGVHLYRKDWSYDRATVAFADAGELRDKGRSGLEFRAAYRMMPWLDLIGSLELVEYQNNDPKFDYQRSMMTLGVRGWY